MDRHALPATFLMCGRAVERAPPLAAEVIRRGHEAADLDRCIAAITKACCQTPQGFFCRGSESIWTRALLQERGFTWVSNAFDDELPYHDSAYPVLSVLTYALDTNDMKFFHPNDLVRTNEMVEYVNDALDVLFAEARQGKPRLLN